MTEVDFDEENQIKKALKFGKRRLAEIRERINELKLLEQDLLSFQENIKTRLDSLNTSPK